MTIYAWPGWCVSRFEMRIIPNTRVFVSPLTQGVQAIDLLGERWQISLDTTPGVVIVDGAAREAFFDRLKGPVNRIAMWNLRLPVPRGTLRGGATVRVVNASLVTVTVVNASLIVVTVITGGPQLTSAVAVLAGSAPITYAQGATLLAGDMIGINGQLVRVMADATADAAGQLVIEFLPRLRAAAAAGLVITWDRPTAVFMLKADGVPTVWRPGMYEAASLDLIETF